MGRSLPPPLELLHLHFFSIHRTLQRLPYKHAEEVTDAWRHVNFQNLRYCTDNCDYMTTGFFKKFNYCLRGLKARHACTTSVTASHGQWGPRLRLGITDIGPTRHVPADHTPHGRENLSSNSSGPHYRAIARTLDGLAYYSTGVRTEFM